MDVHLFPGQGSQYKGMTADLLGDPWISEMTDRAEAWASQLLGCRFGDHLRSGTSPDHDDVQGFLCDQLRILLGSLSIHHSLSMRGITATWRIGHSLGEISALTAAGWLDVDTALRVVCLRSKAIVEHAPPGGMTAVLAPISNVQKALSTCPGLSLSLSTFNSPSQATVSGLVVDLDAFETLLSKNGLTYKRLHAKYPFHGPMMNAAADAFFNSIANVPTRPGEQVWSAIYNRPYTQLDHLCSLLPCHLVLPVLFCQSLKKFAEVGVNNYVEVGGRKALVGLVRDLMKTLDYPLPRLVTTSLPGGESEKTQVGYAADALVSALPHLIPASVSSHTQHHSAPMIHLSSCSSDELQALIIAATGELSRRAQAMGSFQATQSIPLGWSQQTGFAGWQPPHATAAWSQPVPPMAPPAAPMGWMPPGPGWSSPPPASTPAPQSVRQEQIAVPAPLPSPQPAPSMQPVANGNGHGNGGGTQSVPAAPIPVRAPKVIEQPSTSPQAVTASTVPAAETQKSQSVTAIALPESTIDHGDALLNKLIIIYQEATEYPAEILEPDANLEADLGIDSVKQMQVLGLVKERFGFELPEDMDMKGMRSIREVADSIRPLLRA